MSIRQRINEVSIWIALLFFAILIGGIVYQAIVIYPQWTGDLPGSLVSYFSNKAAAEAIARFWQSPVLPVILVSILTALATSWPDRARRNWLILASALFVFALVWTVVWFIPKGVIPLMAHAGAGMTPDEITSRAEAWLFWDRIRSAISFVAYLATVRALTHRLAPVTSAAEERLPSSASATA